MVLPNFDLLNNNVIYLNCNLCFTWLQRCFAHKYIYHYIAQNNTPPSNKTQHTNQHKQ
jgi:hypothetical protein